MKNIIILMTVLSYLLFIGCEKTIDQSASNTKTQKSQQHQGHSHGDDKNHSDHSHGGHSHGTASSHAAHDEENTTLGKTIWTDNFEIFMEYNPMITGEEAHIFLHLTKMSDFTPAGHIHVNGSVEKAGKKISLSEPAMLADGIFEFNFTPETSGDANFRFELDMHEVVETINITAEIFSTKETAEKALNNYNEKNSDKVNFKKEQSWKTEFETALATSGNISETIKTSGELVPAPGDEITYTAIAAGKVKFNRNYALEGVSITKNKLVLTITPSGIENNITAMYQQKKALFEKEKADYERAKQLLAKGYVSPQEYDVIKAEYITAKSYFETISRDYNPDGQLVRSTSKGYIKELYVAEGEYVEAGTKLFTIAKNKKILVRADVSQKYYSKLKNIESASFRSPHSTFFYDTDFLNGQKIAFGKTHSTSTHFIPVYFEINNEVDVLPGSFIEVILRSALKHSAVIIPREALVEEFGSFAVYVQTSAEYFEKREVRLGTFDGFSYEIIKGLKPGERVVTKGAYQVKMASMSDSAPAHTH